MGMIDLYNKSPIFLQNLACSLYGYREKKVRMGDEFNKRLGWLNAQDMADEKTITEYQNAQLRKLIEHCYSTVPYYRRVMDKLGLKPIDIATRKDLVKLPVLTKKDVIENQNDLISKAFNKKDLQLRQTSGTTGTSLTTYATADAVAFQWAVWWRHRARFGVEPDEWHLNFSGRPMIPANQSKPPFWRWNYPMRQALISQQHLVPEKIKHMVEFINNNNFKFFVGYPSNVASFCSYALEQGLKLTNPPKYVFLGAENTQDFQLEAIEAFTGATVSDQYGFSEGCGNASKCEHGTYHEDWEFGILECDHPQQIEGGKLRGNILATGFSNYAFPLIRYQVGDVGVWNEEGYQCSCGRRSSSLSFIDGRIEDYIITPEGNRLMRFGYLFHGIASVSEAQIVQEKLGSIVVRIVKSSSFMSSDELEIRSRIKRYASPSLNVTFEYLDKIPRSSSGKFRPVISELPKESRSL